VDLAVNGNDALSRVRSERYAVMTIDRMLPDFDGIVSGKMKWPWPGILGV
jgi:DNA-binding response OmpR family regulator